MTTSTKVNEYNHAEMPARQLLEGLGWTYVRREALEAERGGQREVLLKGRLRHALLRLNEWMTEEQAYRAVFDLEHIDATGMARNQAVHEYLIYGMPLTVDGPSVRQTRIARFFDFDRPESGLNDFVVTTQFRVRCGNERGGAAADDERMVIPDLVLFVNGVPLVVMEAKSPSLLEVWKSQAVRQLRRYQEAGPEWHGAGAPELFHSTCVWEPALPEPTSPGGNSRICTCPFAPEPAGNLQCLLECDQPPPATARLPRVTAAEAT